MVLIVGGWYVIQWTISKGVNKIGARGEKLEIQRLRGHINTLIINWKKDKIGGGGKYGGVHLSTSAASTQFQNRLMWEGMFKKERKRRKKAKNQPPEAPW